MKNILITGATGFIGSKLIEMLKETKNYNIVVLGTKKIEDTIFINHKGYTFTKEDFIKANINQVDIVVHLGAFTPKNGKQANEIIGSLSNINNSIYLLNNLPNTPEKIIFSSTLDVYDSNIKVIDEKSIINPVSLYGQSKIYCEKMLEQWAKEHDTKLQILRIGHIYGEGEGEYEKIIPITIQKVLNNIEPDIFTDGLEKRAFLHVEDCCNLIIKSIEKEEVDNPINLVSEKSYSIKYIVEKIVELCESDLKVNILNKVTNARSIEFDNTKMVRLIGKEKVSLEEGLKREINYFKTRVK